MRRALIKRNAPSFPSLRPYLSIPRVFRVYADHLLFFFSFPSSSSSSPLLFSSFLFFSSPSQRDNSFLLLANVIARTRFPAGIRRNHGIRDGSPRVPRLIFTPRAMEQRIGARYWFRVIDEIDRIYIGESSRLKLFVFKFGDELKRKEEISRCGNFNFV